MAIGYLKSMSTRLQHGFREEAKMSVKARPGVELSRICVMAQHLSNPA